METEKRKSGLPWAIGLFIFIAGSIIYGRIGNEEMKANKIVTQGVVNQAHHTGSVGIALWYEYKVDGKRIGGSNSFACFSPFIGELFIGKSFPVVYNYKKPESSNLLLTKRDFERFGLEYPDSLLWVEEHVRK
ncbi:MAG: hypothetical protein KA149_10450 [Chitinophagales bacterium]|nr:hypothetical protein [Chitinophagales bacterium]